MTYCFANLFSTLAFDRGCSEALDVSFCVPTSGEVVDFYYFKCIFDQNRMTEKCISAINTADNVIVLNGLKVLTPSFFSYFFL